MNLIHLFDQAVQQNASDIHLASGEPPRLRVSGELVTLSSPAVDVVALLEPILSPDDRARIAAGLPSERTIAHGNRAFVGIFFRFGEQGLAATFRMLPTAIPDLSQIAEGAEELFEKVVESPRGLVLVSGPTGSGKWTTVCSVVDAINARKASRIFVVEAHPNYRFASKKGFVTQLHVGQDCDSYARALEIAHHADLDVVAMDDIPTLEVLRQAMILAESGHLVIANLSPRTPAEAIERLIESSGDEAPALRRALAQNLLAVTAQRLLPGIGGKGRAPAYEWIAGSPTVREALLNGLDLAAAQREDPESRTLNATLDRLVASGRVEAETAALHRISS